MKKKFNLWLNIATICLCICTIAVGVYSAQNATLTVTGQVGFKAHNCEMVITNYKIENSSRDPEATAVSPAFSDYLPSGSTTRTSFPTEGITIKGTTAVDFNMGKFYFIDDISQGEVPDIIITFTIKNNSSFKVTATMTLSEALTSSTSGISVVDYTLSQGFDAKGGARAERELTIRLSISDSTVESLDFASNQLFSVSFEKDDNANIYAPGEYYVEDGKLFVQYGYYPTTDKDVKVVVDLNTNAEEQIKMYGSNSGKPIRWVAFSNDDGNTALTTQTSVPTSGTYCFISEYIVTSETKQFNYTNSYAVENKNPNDYEVSLVRKYIKGDFVKEYMLTALEDKANARTLPTEDFSYFAPGVDEDYKNAGKIINDCKDKLWLISRSEYLLVSKVTNSDIGFYPGQVDSEYKVSGAEWWLRSPVDSGDYAWIYRVRPYPAYPSTQVDDYGYIRPAFQITIG